ncbi:MAG: hypothetical protein ACTHJ5_19660 [Ilyomonas sp.]
MKKIYFITLVFGGLIACNNNRNIPDRAVRDSVKNPLTVQPETAAIPKDMEIKNDSVVMPDTSIKK